MQSVNATSAPICRSVCRNQCRAFFYQLSTLLHGVANKCKLRVHCHDVCNIAPSTCISVSCVEIPLNVISSNVHQNVVLYKTVQSFCSDVVVQNVNVISSAACGGCLFQKTPLCFTSQVFYVGNIPICSSIINTITVIIATIAFIMIIIITITFIINFNITIILIINITIIIFIINITIIIK